MTLQVEKVSKTERILGIGGAASRGLQAAGPLGAVIAGGRAVRKPLTPEEDQALTAAVLGGAVAGPAGLVLGGVVGHEAPVHPMLKSVMSGAASGIKAGLPGALIGGALGAGAALVRKHSERKRQREAEKVQEMLDRAKRLREEWGAGAHERSRWTQSELQRMKAEAELARI